MTIICSFVQHYAVQEDTKLYGALKWWRLPIKITVLNMYNLQQSVSF